MIGRTLYDEQRRRALLAVDAQRALYRHELGVEGGNRQKHLQSADAANRRIAELLPGAVDAGVPVVEIARLTGYSRPTLYRMLQEARPLLDKATEFKRWAAVLAAASEEVGHAAMRDELAAAAGVEVDELCATLTDLFEYALERLYALEPTQAVLLLELVSQLPHIEKVILTHLFFQRMPLQDVVRSVDRSRAEIVVWAVLALLRVLPQLEKSGQSA